MPKRVLIVMSDMLQLVVEIGNTQMAAISRNIARKEVSK